MAPRSRTGCLTCRQRKLKCSEERPICAQCVRANRECVPSSGITFRHQQNPSMNGGERGEDGLKSFYGYKETFGKSTTWVDIPRDLTFVHTSNPYEDEDGDIDVDSDLAAATSIPPPPTGFEHAQGASDFGLGQTSYPAYATRGLEALSAAVASQDQYTLVPPVPPINHHQRSISRSSEALNSPQHGQATPSQNLDFILNPPSNMSSAESNIDPRLHSHQPATAAAAANTHPSTSHVRTASFAALGEQANSRWKGPTGSIEDPELAFLLRDYAERPGLWMDLFDLDLFFASKVPVLAVTCPLLLYACAALSAKSLARVSGRKPIMGGQISPSRQSRMEIWPGPPLDCEGWMRKGRECYDIAVSLLRQALAGASRPPTASLPEDASPATLQIVQDVPLPTTDSDELVAATAILCVYEFLDASGHEWSRHLDGTKTLFEIAKDGMVPPPPLTLASAQLGLDASLTPSRRAVFWNFARQDMLSAFINNTCTRLDTADLHMWRSAGLKLTPDGFVSPSNPKHAEYIKEQAMSDDMISNALIWLTMKLANFIAAGDDLPESIAALTPPLRLGVRQRELLDYWESLDEQLRVWHEGLLDVFRPTALHTTPDGAEHERQAWFPRPMCASTMQWYNFARVQLLHNKPHLTTATPIRSRLGMGSAGASLAGRYASYAAILQQSRVHAKEIVAIALGRADEGTRIHSVQPLWTAGLVLGNDDGSGVDGGLSPEVEAWRRTIVGLLRGIQQDMGWASEYRVQSLLDLWGVEEVDSP